VGALVLALTGVVYLLAHTGGSFTFSHLASSFPLLTLDIESLSWEFIPRFLCDNVFLTLSSTLLAYYTIRL
jgi:hypothetical protein